MTSTPEFQFTEILPLGKDDTAYRLLTTDGVSTFSLFERLAPLKTPVNPPPRSFERNLQHWLKSSPDGTLHIQFIGHLPAAQAQALYNSLR